MLPLLAPDLPALAALAAAMSAGFIIAIAMLPAMSGIMFTPGIIPNAPKGNEPACICCIAAREAGVIDIIGFALLFFASFSGLSALAAFSALSGFSAASFSV